MISIVANFSEKLPVLFFFLLLSVSTANLSCLLATTFSSLRFFFNSLSSPCFNLLRVARRCFSWFSIFSFSRLILNPQPFFSEVLFTLSFSFLSERFFFVRLGKGSALVRLKAALAQSKSITRVSQVSLYRPKMTLSMRVGYVIPPTHLI